MKLLDAIHRWMGGLIGLLLALLGLTGTILLHKDAWIMLPHSGDTQAQATALLANTAQRLMSDAAHRPQSITFATSDFGLDRLTYADGSGAYVTQAGDPVAKWSSQWERPELWLFDLHHHLVAGEWGETLIGIAALCRLFFLVSGVVLWWRTRQTFQVRLLPARFTRPAIVRHHRDLGVIVAPLLAMSLVTGAVLVFRPMAALLFGPGAPEEINLALSAPAARPGPVAKEFDWAGMITRARERFPQAEVRSLSLPRNNDGLITLRMRGQQEWLPNGRTTVWFAADNGELVAARDAAELSRTVIAYNALYPLHAGKVGGLLYRVVVTLSGFALTLLGSLTVWTFWFARSKRKPQ